MKSILTKKTVLFAILILFISFTSYAIDPITGDSSVCKGNVITLNNATSGGTWTSSNTAIAIIGSSTGNLTGVSAGVVIITYTLGISYATQSVTVNPLPVVTISGRDSICDGGFDTLIAHSPGSSVSWILTMAMSCVICDTTIVNPAIPHSVTPYYAIAVDSNGCIDTSVAFSVTINPLPVINILPRPATVCLDSTLQLFVSGASTYFWTPDVGLSCDTCTDPIVSITSSVNYMVTGITALGCVDSDIIPVAVDSNCTTGVPLLHNNIEVEIFPNPSSGFLNIVSSVTIIRISISNLLGQMLYERVYNTSQASIDVSGFPNGLYYIRVNDGEVRKFVKE